MQQTAYKIIKKLQDNGFLAYLAGGSVRDMLMGKNPQDYDIATSATPDQIENLLKKTIPIGKKFGVILAIENNHHFEIATFRSDSGYSDGRRPDAVSFSTTKKDALRRDFTINGMFYDPIKDEILDFIGGKKDLEDGILRFIGNPHERIQEDKLRILRAIRFKNRLGFKYGEKTQKALIKNAELIRAVSRERIGEELNKILLNSTRIEAIEDLIDFKILDDLIPEVTALKDIPQPIKYHQEGGVLTHTLMVMQNLKKDANLALVWAALLHDTGKRRTFVRKADRIHFDGHAKESQEISKEVGRRFRFNNVLKSKIEWLVKNHMHLVQILEARLAHRIKLFMHPWFEDLLELHRCDESGSIPIDLSLYYEIKKEYDDFKSKKLLTTPIKAIINGNELLEKFKIKKGPDIGKYLNMVHEEQLEGKIKTKKEAFSFLNKIIKDSS